MALTPEQTEHFARLHRELFRFAEKELQPLLPPSSGAKDSEAATARLFAIRDALHKHPQVIDSFVRQNPASLPAPDLEIVAKWKAARVGGFYVLRHCGDYSIFMGADEHYVPIKGVFAVLPIQEPFTTFIGESLPIFVRTALLPFQQQIVFDGILQIWPVDLGEDMRDELTRYYEIISKKSGIFVSLCPDVKQRPEAIKSPEK